MTMRWLAAILGLLALLATQLAAQDAGGGIDALLAAAKAKPGDKVALTALLKRALPQAAGLIKQSQPDAAISLLCSLDEVCPNNAVVLALRGKAYVAKGEADLAIADLSNARSASDGQNKARPSIDTMLAAAYKMKGDWANVAVSLQSYATHGGTVDAEYDVALLVALDKAGQRDQVVNVLRDALEKYPDDPSIQAFAQKYGRALKKQDAEADMTQGGTLHFAIKFQNVPEDPATKDMISRLLEQAYDTVTRQFGAFPPGAVNVAVYSSHQDYLEKTDSPHWSLAHYEPEDGGIRIGLPAHLEEKDLADTLTHEFTHLIVDVVIKHKRVPAWLTEGLAQVVSGRDMTKFENFFRRWAHRNQPPPLSSLDPTINAGGTIDPHLGYYIGWSVATYIINKWGWSTIVTTLEKMGDGSSFEEAFAEDYASLQKEWWEAEKTRINLSSAE